MTRLALRGMAERKLRSALTAVAVLLGVAMIAGTYILTDQIRTAFDDISRQSVEGLDVVITPEETFTPTLAGEQTILDERLVEQAERVEGVAAANGEVVASGRLVIDGEAVETFGAPSFVIGDAPDEFENADLVEGREPRAGDEVMILEQNAEDQGVAVGDRVGVATRSGIEPVTVVGIFAFGEGGSSLGGTSIIVAPREQVQRWFDLQGKVASVSVIADPGVDPAELAERLRAELPGGLKVQTAEQNATETSDEINDQIGSFLTPALLALAGAAVLVGAFIIFNTFSITVVQRTREFAMLRAIGATRRQVLGAVAGEALIIGVLASLAGIGAGIGLARLFSALFDAVGFGVPRAGLELAPRTITISLAVGIGVTLLAALIPAVRATRVPPVAAMSSAPPRPTRRSRWLSAVVAALVSLAGVALALQGLFGEGGADARLGSLAGGAVLIFVGVALSARYLVRPIAAVVGWPIERAFATTGRLARENAVRNPSRTAITSAALMVGLGLVVFVAVFAEGLKSSIGDQVDELVRADVFVFSQDTTTPVPVGAERAVAAVEGVEAAVGTRFDQVEVNGEHSNVAYDVVIGIDPGELADVYAFDWLKGDDELLAELGRNETLIEEQFSLAHDLEVGESYGVVTPTGGSAELTAIGIYRDPTILQGSIASTATLAGISPARDPFALLVAIADEADAGAVESEIERRLERFPSLEVENRGEYEETTSERLNQIIYLLYALLAMSVVISLFGIANSLFLSIHERTRELGLLRAVGATAGQLRRVIRYESVITAVIGGVLGTIVGIAFAWLAIQSLSEFGFSLAIPVGQLAVFLALAVLVGVIGAIAPARRAARVDVLDAIHYE